MAVKLDEIKQYKGTTARLRLLMGENYKPLSKVQKALAKADQDARTAFELRVGLHGEPQEWQAVAQHLTNGRTESSARRAWDRAMRVVSA